jgi:hypothetical protein
MAGLSPAVHVKSELPGEKGVPKRQRIDFVQEDRIGRSGPQHRPDQLVVFRPAEARQLDANASVVAGR